MADPRVFFAAERTLLAWVRSGLTVMALGFVVARFGLFLALIGTSHPAAVEEARGHWPSSAFGIALVILGSAAILGALWNHRRYVRSLPPEDVPDLPVPRLTSIVAISLAATGGLLAMYLAIG